MSDLGEFIEPGTVRFERLLPAPAGTVWAFLVEPEKRALWLAGGPMELRPGGKVELVFNNAALCDPGDAPPEKYREHAGESRMHGRVIVCEPPRLLRYSWAEPEEGIGTEQGSEVTFELTPRGKDHTLLILTHRRLKPGEQAQGVLAGWHAHLGILADRVAGRTPASFWRSFAAAEAGYRSRGTAG